MTYSQPLFQSLINRKCVDKSSNAKTFKKKKKKNGGKFLLRRCTNLETRRMVKFPNTKCEKDLKSGFLCLCVSGVLSVAYQTGNALLRKFYFCPVKTYIHASSPWTNLKLPVHITRQEFVSEAEFWRALGNSTKQQSNRNLHLVFEDSGKNIIIWLGYFDKFFFFHQYHHF